jgi:tripartite-type tricarboxylate transporter receptor subunit TctC
MLRKDWGKEFEAKRRVLSTLFRPNTKVGDEWDERFGRIRRQSRYNTPEQETAMHSIVFRIGLAACAMLSACGALAQAYPSQPIKVVVPFTPGTGMDIIARSVGPKLAERLGQPVIVENKPGASGNIGAEMVARSAPDGHTVMITANTMLIAATLYRNVPYDPLSDFSPISLAAWGTLLLTASPKANINSVADLIAQAKASPGKLTYASPGVGTPHHMSMELFKDLTGTNLLHVPYKGSAGALTDLLSGEVNVGFVPIHVALPHVKAGRLKAIAVGSAKRHPNAPDLPTLQELGVKGAEVDMWYAFMAPKGTHALVVTRLGSELRAILSLPEIKANFDKQGMDAASSSPEELNALMRRDSARWAAVIKKNNITAD